MSMSCFDCHDYMDGYNQAKKELKEQLIENLEQYKQEELLFHNEERAKYFDEVIKVLKEKQKKNEALFTEVLKEIK